MTTAATIRTTTDAPQGAAAGYYDAESCDLGAFADLAAQEPDPSAYPHAAEFHKRAPIYDAPALRPLLADPAQRRALMAEWARALAEGPGIVALRGAYEDLAAIDAATTAYEQIIAAEKGGSGGGGDHFAAAGANDRVWNSLQKLCEHAPEAFLAYFSNPMIDAVCEAWLGPNYQMTAQVNLVHPGGDAQQAHRDYHLGFQTAEVCAKYPAHMHALSPLLTLQGAVAHCDMPIESGPTKLLPFSQLYLPGYAAWRRDDFRAFFEERHIQLPLRKGDALFFNPALFHAAGANRSADIHRMANLLQISSAFGRAMETVDRLKMCRILYPHAQAAVAGGALSGEALQALIAATAEGYSFPTNLDSDPPIGGLAPETQAALFGRALAEGLSLEAFEAALTAQAARRLA